MGDRKVLTSRARRRNWEILTIAAAVLAAAFALEVPGPEDVSLAGIVMPRLCASRSWFGVACPGCGLTRSFVCLAHGDLAAAWDAHRLGFFLAAFLALQIPYRAWELARNRSLLSAQTKSLVGYTVIALLLANWLFGLVLA